MSDTSKVPWSIRTESGDEVAIVWVAATSTVTVEDPTRHAVPITDPDVITDLRQMP